MSNVNPPITAIEASVMAAFEESLASEGVAEEVVQFTQDVYKTPKLPTAQSFLDSLKNLIEDEPK